MARLQQQYKQEDFYGIGIVHSVKEENIGTLWHSAYILGASFIFTVGNAYKKQGSDVVNAWSKIPLYHYENFTDLKNNIPHDTRIIGVEMDDKSEILDAYKHPQRAIYLLGNEKIGLSRTNSTARLI
ncbi:MAG: TrmH family RNA methyltransferase [Mariprofundaceae bacterium]